MRAIFITVIFVVLIVYALFHREGSRKQLLALSTLFLIFSVYAFVNINDFYYWGFKLNPIQALAACIGMLIISAGCLRLPPILDHGATNLR